MRSSRVAAFSASILALLIPKCPLCLAAWAGVIGLGEAMRGRTIPGWVPAALILCLFLPAAALSIRKRAFDAPGLYWIACAAAVTETLYFALPQRASALAWMVIAGGIALIWKLENGRRATQ